MNAQIQAIRAAIANGPHAALLAQIDAEAQVTRDAEATANEYMACFESWLGGHTAPDAEEAARRAVVARFEKVSRADYLNVWRRAGQPFGTRLHRAAGWELRAREFDQIFIDALANGAITDGQTRDYKHMGLTALVMTVEHEWREAHLRMLGREKKNEVLRARHDAREREWQARQAVAA